MRCDHYLAVVARSETVDQWRYRLGVIGQDQDLSLHEGDGFLLLASRPPLWMGTTRTAGAVIGAIYPRDARSALTAFSDDEACAAQQTGGTSLIERFWGDYVAFVSHENGPSVIRAPFGDLPCYVHQTADATLMTSHVALLRAAQFKARVDWHAVGLQLIAPDIRRSQTCLSGVEELACGDRLRPFQTGEHETLWSPWHFAGATRRCDNAAVSAEHLRAVLLGTIGAQTNDDVPNSLCLSGGVDSSIAAAALTAAGRECRALTMITRDPAGDERAFARAVADHCGMPLVEVVRSTSMVDLTKTEARGLPYPTETAFSQATRHALNEVGGASDARVLHGGGGDQIFCSLQSAAPLADLIRAKGFDRRIPALTLDLARLANTSAGAVARQAVSRLIGQRSSFRWPSNLECLTPMGRAMEPEALRHDWLSPPPGIGSGSAGHVALTMGALGIVQSPAWDARPPWRAILLSQPVVEACLAVPPWLWFERGRNRAIARRAVEDLLPTGHLWRPGKGAMASFMIEIFDANRALLRSMIGDGALVRAGLVDRDTCLQILDDPHPVRGNDWTRLLQLADVEAWLASW